MNEGPRVLVSGWVGAGNIGDELIFSSLLSKLRSRGVVVEVVSREPEKTSQLHGVDAVGWYDIPGVVGAVRGCDGFILGPGGLLQDETSIWNLPAHLHRVLIAEILRRPVLGVGLGVGALNTTVGRKIVGWLLNSVPITVRDNESALLAHRCGLQDVSVTADVAFGLTPPQVEPVDRIVASFRPFSGSGGLLTAKRSNTKLLERNNTTTATAAALDELSSRTSLPVHLLALGGEIDHHWHELIADAMVSEVSIAQGEVSTLLDEVARSRLVVAMRYHGVVAAIMGLRPVVAVTYSQKVRSAANLMGSSALIVENNPHSLHKIANGADLISREHYLDALLEERREAERGNDEAIDDLLSGLR